MAVLNFVDNRSVFFAARFVDPIVVVDPDTRPIGRNYVDVELVNVVELGRFSFGSAGHAGELLVQPEIVLDGDGRESLRLAIDLHALLRLHRLMQSITPATAWHFAPGKFIDNDHF